MNYKVAVLLSTGFLAACGQSGALQLPSDPNYDKRAKYLLYKNSEAKPVANNRTEASTTPSVDQP